MDRINSNAVYEIAKANERLAKRIEELEKELEHYRWIPVEDRLPGTERVLITNGEVVKEGYRRPDGIWKYGVKEDELFSNLSSHSVVAWMPLPKPVNL